MKTSLRFLSKSLLFAAAGVLAAAAPSMAANVSFKANNNWAVPVPTIAGQPTSSPNNIVIYDLPATGSVYAGPAAGSFDVRAQVQGATTESVAGYGIIMQVGVASAVTFTTPDPNPAGDNNMLAALRTPLNSTLSIILGETNVPNQNQSNKSIGVIGLFPTANANTTVTNNDGLFRVPYSVTAGAAGTVAPNFSLVPLEFAVGGNEYSGFAQSNGTLMTNPGAFPHTANTIEIRRSRRADMNGDLLIDGEDIQPFIDALSNYNAFKAARPYLQHDYITDLTQDHAIDGEDIQPFINILSGTGTSPQAVPEPSTFALAAFGIGGLLAARRIRRKAK